LLFAVVVINASIALQQKFCIITFDELNNEAIDPPEVLMERQMFDRSLKCEALENFSRKSSSAVTRA